MPMTKVALLVTPGFSPFHLSVPCILFGHQVSDTPRFTVYLCAERPGLQQAADGFAAQAPYGLEAFSTADIIILPYWPSPHLRPSAALSAALYAAHLRGARVAGLCLGAFALGHAGLLDGRQASTHWEYERDFQQLFPEARLDINALYTEDTGILTSAGTAAAMDCCLHLIRACHGSAVANQIARRMVVSPHREGGQAQFIEHPVPQSTQDARINGLIEYLRHTLQDYHDIETLAERNAMSRRSLTRHFRQATGQSITQWLTQERLRLAQIALETTDARIERIAEASGFNSPVTFRQQFIARFGIRPSEWRKRFQRK